MLVLELIEKINIIEKRINYEEYKDNYLEKLAYSYPTLNLNEEIILFKLYKVSKDKTFKDIIFKCHLKDVYEACKDKTDYRYDLISQGNILLYDYIEEFEYSFPYTTFKENLMARLNVLFKNKGKISNENTNDTQVENINKDRPILVIVKRSNPNENDILDY